MSAGESRIKILNETDLAHAVVRAGAVCAEVGFDEVRARLVATVVSELGRNIIKYTSGGELVLRTVSRGHTRGIEVVAGDHGPGIPDIDRALEEHFSSGGTLGLGLPGVKRIMDEFGVVSEPGRGTTVTAVKWV